MKPSDFWVAELYALAANKDFSAYLQLCELYKDYVAETVIEMKRKHVSDLPDEDLKFAAYFGIGSSLEKIELNSNCPSYAAWVEKNIRIAIQKEILRAKGLIPPELN
ncbi:MAG: hypothetical protein G01um101419_597 [Parcubacteria group bacterium Gr01-1014_19]|nr:MAG: hypothetical protein G01um101419_597 [Parcubacteria group bacterium Gr01-1014_19]